MTLQELLDRLGDREDVTITSEEWSAIIRNWDSDAWKDGLEPTTRLCFFEAGIVAWLLPHVTGRDKPVKVRMPEIEGRIEPVTPEELANAIKERFK
jgi:hypothetical protein